MGKLVDRTITRPGYLGSGFQFTSVDELRFRGWLVRRSIPHVRAALCLGICSILLLSLIDMAMLSTQIAGTGLMIRALVVAPILGITVAATWHPRWSRVSIPLLTASVMALGLGEIALEHLREESGFPHAYMSFTLVIVAQYYHSRLPFPMVCACGWTLFGAKYVCLMLDDPSSTYAVYAAALGIIANAIGMLAALEYESSMRNEFKHRTRLKQLAERDGLTGLYNRRVMEGMLPALWQQAITERCSLVVMMVDIDHFKPYNDMLGHPRGDECLKRVAEILSKLARRPNDFCTRYGGEEFCIIYYGVDSEFADDMAEAIRNSVRASALPHPASSIADVVTVSVGAVSCQPRIGIGPSDLIERADSALYEAKHRGRDQYVVDVL